MSDMTERERRLKSLAFDAGWEACEKFNEPTVRELMAQVWSAGWLALSREEQRQRKDPTYPIGKDAQNPYLPEGQVHP